MLDPMIEGLIADVLAGDALKNALDFFAYLSASDMQFERGKGYWADKLYWLIKYKGEYVCFILVNGSEDKPESESWTIWTDDSGSSCFADFPLDEYIKAIAWDHVDICSHCGGCKHPGGSRKIIFDEPFDNVCITAMKFVNPDADALGCIKQLMEIRKNDILKNH